jgi:hypothetical protein
VTRKLSATWVLILAACAQQPPTPTVEKSVDQRLDDLERRVQRLEGRPQTWLPYRDRREIEAHIKSLEGERDRLLLKTTEEHPEVRDLDRRLKILREQLQMLP